MKNIALYIAEYYKVLEYKVNIAYALTGDGNKRIVIGHDIFYTNEFLKQDKLNVPVWIAEPTGKLLVCLINDDGKCIDIVSDDNTSFTKTNINAIISLIEFYTLFQSLKEYCAAGRE